MLHDWICSGLRPLDQSCVATLHQYLMGMGSQKIFLDFALILLCFALILLWFAVPVDLPEAHSGFFLLRLLYMDR